MIRASGLRLRPDLAQLLHLRGTHQFPKPIANRNSRWDFILKNIPTMRKNGCDAGSYILPLNQRDMPHLHTVHIRNSIPFSRW